MYADPFIENATTFSDIMKKSQEWSDLVVHRK